MCVSFQDFVRAASVTALIQPPRFIAERVYWRLVWGRSQLSGAFNTLYPMDAVQCVPGASGWSADILGEGAVGRIVRKARRSVPNAAWLWCCVECRDHTPKNIKASQGPWSLEQATPSATGWRTLITRLRLDPDCHLATRGNVGGLLRTFEQPGTHIVTCARDIVISAVERETNHVCGTCPFNPCNQGLPVTRDRISMTTLSPRAFMVAMVSM